MNDLSIPQSSMARRWLSAWWPYLLVLGFLVLFPLLAGATIADPAAAQDGAGGLGGLMQRAETGAAKFWQGMIIQILIFAIFAMSYDLLLGYTGILSFGHAMFFGTGGYAMAILIGRNFNWSFGMALLAVIAVALVQSLVFGVLS
ncbi:MAG TPA: hypothetical protein PKE20_15425, partial [Promineifilum sp.]|nr:hypothetical protein [Promineifilum sp.]